MRTLLQIVNERAPTPVIKAADIVASYLVSTLPIEEMRSNRGKDYDATTFYQIRVKPKEKGTALPEILASMEAFLKSSASKKFGISDVEVNSKSRNSSKYSSVSFDYQGATYDAVVALGGNKGEDFEKDLILKMDLLIAGEESAETEQAAAAFAALEAIDKSFRRSNIKSVSKRSGSTQRSGDMSADDIGKIIADIIIELKNGDKKYISLKNSDGGTVANFGVAKAFTEDLKVNTASDEWKNWIAPLGLDPKKIEQGLQASQDQTELPFDDIEKVDKKMTKTSAVYKLLQKMWGANYYYLREKKDGFQAMKIDSDYVENELIKDLRITEIRYPSMDRKQVTVSLVSASKKYKVEIRNSKGKIRPTELKFGIAGDVK